MIPYGEWLKCKNDPSTMFMPVPGGVLVFVTVSNAPARGCALHFVSIPDTSKLTLFLCRSVDGFSLEAGEPDRPIEPEVCQHTRGAMIDAFTTRCYYCDCRGRVDPTFQKITWDD